MALNTFECNYLTPLHFKGLSNFLNASGKAEIFGQWLEVEKNGKECNGKDMPQKWD